MKNKILLTILLCQPLLVFAQSDKIYQWRDSDGVVHFDQHPPNQGNYKTITPTPSNIVPAPHMDASPNLDSLPPPILPNSVSNPPAKPIYKHTKEECDGFQKSLDTLENTPFKRLFLTDSEGKDQKMTVEQYQEQDGKYKESVQECTDNPPPDQ